MSVAGQKQTSTMGLMRGINDMSEADEYKGNSWISSLIGPDSCHYMYKDKNSTSPHEPSTRKH